MCEDLSKDAAQLPAPVWTSRAPETFANRGGRGPARFPGLHCDHTLYRAGQPPACWPLERPPPLLGTSMPGGVRGREHVAPAGQTRRLSHRQGCHRHPVPARLPAGAGQRPSSPTSRRINRGLPPVVRHAGQAPGLRRQVPGTVLVMNSASGGGPGMSHGMPAPGDPADMTNMAASLTGRPPVSSARCGP